MSKRGSESGGATIVANAMPNKGMELTASSVRSAPAFGSSSYLALGTANFVKNQKQEIGQRVPSMNDTETELETAEQLLIEGDSAGALRHTRRAQACLAAIDPEPPALLASVACQLVDCGADLRSPQVVREGLAILESLLDSPGPQVDPGALQYNIGNAKKTLYDLEKPSPEGHFNPAAISLLTEAKNHYWRAYKLLGYDLHDPRLMVNLAGALDQCCRVAEALRWYAEALLAVPGFPMAHLNRAIALLFLKRMSGTITISQLAEARRSYRLAETAPLPPHMVEMARQGRIAIDEALADLGWSDLRIAEYDEQHRRESGDHDPYWQFCLDSFLALNEHSLYCRCMGARRDDLSIPTSAKPVGGPCIPRLELLLNRIKSEFCLARALFYQATTEDATWDLHSFEGTYSELYEQEAIGMAPEFLRTSFRLCFGILDRIAQGLSELYELAAPGEALYFESFWRPSEQRKKGAEVRWDKINAQSNLGLVALYSIATDLNRVKGQWAFFKEHRNHLEHGLLVVMSEDTHIPEESRPQRIALEEVPLESFRAHVLHLLQLTASAIFSFVFCVREEGYRSSPEGTAVRIEMGKKSVGKE